MELSPWPDATIIEKLHLNGHYTGNNRLFEENNAAWGVEDGSNAMGWKNKLTFCWVSLRRPLLHQPCCRCCARKDQRTRTCRKNAQTWWCISVTIGNQDTGKRGEEYFTIVTHSSFFENTKITKTVRWINHVKPRQHLGNWLYKNVCWWILNSVIFTAAILVLEK